MKAFRTVKSIITPLDKINVDTDQIIPKQFLKLVQRSGFGKYLFYDWRYAKKGNDVLPRPDFVLNDDRYQDSSILVAGENFGCGSSREHAVWALVDYGFKVIIAPSFADIFYNNCFKNGLLPIVLRYSHTQKILQFDGKVEIDLQDRVIKMYDKYDANILKTIHFEIEPHRRTVLLEGLDEIAQTLQYKDVILEFESELEQKKGAAPPMVTKMLS